MDECKLHKCADRIFEDVVSRVEARIPTHQRPLLLRSDHVRDLVLSDIERHLRDLVVTTRLPVAAGGA
jgi:hypothetical protein